MRASFPDAEVRGYEPLVPTMINHPKDRHVLAAATYARAEVIVTTNLKDFSPAALKFCGVEAIHPDDFLMDLLASNHDDVVRCVQEQITDLREPPWPLDEFAARLARTAATFASAVRGYLAWPGRTLVPRGSLSAEVDAFAAVGGDCAFDPVASDQVVLLEAFG